MRLLVLSSSAVRSVLGYSECADAMREALIARARGEVFQPLRTVLRPPTAPGLMGLMPAYQQGKQAGTASRRSASRQATRRPVLTPTRASCCSQARRPANRLPC